MSNFGDFSESIVFCNMCTCKLNEMFAIHATAAIKFKKGHLARFVTIKEYLAR